MSLALKTLAGLILGLLAGMAAAAFDLPALAGAAAFIEPIGALWVNAIRATVVPLVVSLLIVGVATSGDAGLIGRVGGRALAWFLVLLGGAAAVTALLGPVLLAGLPLDPASVEALRASAGGAPPPADLPTARDWVVALVPTNALGAAARGELLPLIIFTVALAVAATRLDAARRERLVGFFDALAETMLVLVRWVLALAPVGVFALALPLGVAAGASAAAALLWFVGAACLTCVVISAALYPVAAVFGGVSFGAFARASAPAQALAAGSRSSVAALPAAIEGAEEHLDAPDTVTGLFLPLAVSTFRISFVVPAVLGAMFLARVYGVELGVAEVVTVALTSVFLSFSVPPIPGGSILIMAPLLASVGVPPAGVGILLAIDTVPDMFRTPTNITGDMAVAAVLGRAARRGAQPPGGAAAPAGAARRSTSAGTGGVSSVVRMTMRTITE